MKKIYLYLFLTAFCCVNTLRAQEETGSGMLLPQFEQGVVFFKNGTRSAAPLNYSLLQQEMLFLQPDSTVLAIANIPEIVVIVIGERRFLPAYSAGIFYEEVPVGGDNSFFIQRKAMMLSEGKSAGYGGYSQTSSTTSYNTLNNAGQLVKLKPDEKFRLKMDNTYYLKSGNSYKKFFSAKTLGKLFKGHAAEIETFAKEQSVNFTKPEDVTRIVEYGYGLMGK
ncbi:MAG: hypothetical protein LBE91_03395 [Tannerella sp.]|jgi:hypothetical protein|nr:hypothetical protein [Tannerella sp.]